VTTEPLTLADSYLARGWSVIPVEPCGKRPLVGWSVYQQRHATASEVREWRRQWPKANIGVVTGKVSGLIVLDADNAKGNALAIQRGLPVTVASATGGGGWHNLYQHPGFECRNFARRLPGLDFRGDGGFIVVPPSVHPSGAPYRWLPGQGPDDVRVAPAPPWLLELVKSSPDGQPQSVEHWRDLAGTPVEKGARNDTLCRLTGHLLRRRVDPLVVLSFVSAWNGIHCKPPLPTLEVERIVASITEAEARRRGVLS